MRLVLAADVLLALGARGLPMCGSPSLRLELWAHKLAACAEWVALVQEESSDAQNSECNGATPTETPFGECDGAIPTETPFGECGGTIETPFGASVEQLLLRHLLVGAMEQFLGPFHQIHSLLGNEHERRQE